MPRWKTFILGGCLVATTFAFEATASTQRVNPSFLPGGALADAPHGFVAMCARDAEMCQRSSRSSDVRETAGRAEKMVRLRKVNSHVNARVYQRSDFQSYGVAELWTLPGGGSRPSGDCEDLALEKRSLLLQSGYFAPDTLVLAVIYSGRTGLHTVLVARLEDGDYVLDSADRAIVRWDRAGYTWLRQQSRENPLSWLTVERSNTSATSHPKFDVAQVETAKANAL